MDSDIVSILIPSRNEPYLRHTVEDVLAKARGPIEVIVILDGAPEVEPLPEDPRITVIRHETPKGLRAGINTAVSVAKGKYIMKLDAHCMVAQGFDLVLKADCEPNWMVIPRRKRLEPLDWSIKEVHKVDVDYEYLSYPDNPDDWGGPGLHGRQWNQRSVDRKEGYDIDDNMSFQASAWFMHKQYFHDLDLMDEENYGIFYNEGQEEGLKCWLSGGQVKVNKKTWYAHWHKGKQTPEKPSGRGYHISREALAKGGEFTNKWITNSTGWKKQTLPFSWLIEHFWPVPGWPEDWKEKLYGEKGEPWPTT